MSTFHHLAATATITTKGARLQGKDRDHPYIGSWNSEDGGVEWQGIFDHPGTFHVTLIYACNHSGAGSIINFSADGITISDVTRDTGSWDDFNTHELSNQLVITKTGLMTFILAPGKKKSSAFMKLSEIILTPIKSKQ